MHQVETTLSLYFWRHSSKHAAIGTLAGQLLQEQHERPEEGVRIPHYRGKRACDLREHDSGVHRIHRDGGGPLSQSAQPTTKVSHKMMHRITSSTYRLSSSFVKRMFASLLWP